MGRKLELKVGQEVIIREEGDSIRYLKNTEGINLNNMDKWTYKTTISKEGRKYITTQDGNKYDINIDYRLHDGYGYKDRIYLSKKDVIEDFERERILWKTKNFFNYSSRCNNISYDDIKIIDKIISKYEE